jgi:signal transduction histidine kinase
VTPPPPGKDATGRLLIGVLAGVMGSFVVTLIVAQTTSAEIETLADTIVSTTAPSIAHLAGLRGAVFEAELTLSEHLRKGDADVSAFEKSLAVLNEHVQRYLTLPVLSGEQPYWRETQTALVRFDDAVRKTIELVTTRRNAEALREFSNGVQPAGERLIESSLRAIDFHAQNSRQFASRIKEARRRSIVVARVLTVMCVALGIAGLLLILAQARRHRFLIDAHVRFHEARADELEQFAGRVAHDLRNPLFAAKMAAELALARLPDAAREAVTRIQRSLSRADALTNDLLDFARSGAQPEPGARTDVGEVLSDFLRGIAPEAEELQIQLSLEPTPPVLVACGPGVYLSLVGNLVRNAIKYMGRSATRHITVRVTEDESAVRTEISDTGPGIAAENLASLFEPYFRVGQDRAKEGLGLGLATVKKLAEGHHGRVGVTSERGKGSTFWFTLPRAGSL